MKNIFSILFTLFFISCSTEPQPLVVGKDECYFCKMPYADAKFGAEIITEKGKLYKFDDIGCMIDFIKNNLDVNVKVKNILAVSYTNNQKFLNLNECAFLKSSDLHSPMNSGIAAFASRSEAETFLKEFPGDIFTWNQLQQKFK